MDPSVRWKIHTEAFEKRYDNFFEIVIRFLLSMIWMPYWKPNRTGPLAPRWVRRLVLLTFPVSIPAVLILMMVVACIAFFGGILWFILTIPMGLALRMWNDK